MIGADILRRKHRPWTEAEDARLRAAFQASVAELVALARDMQRTFQAVKVRRNQMRRLARQADRAAWG